MTIKILVLSDSHRMNKNINHILEMIGEDIKYVIHLGDCSQDIMPFVQLYKNIQFYFVGGNSDFGWDVDREQMVSVRGKRIWLSHGHEYGVKTSYDRITYAAEERQADVCLFGHTHVPAVFYCNSVLFMNPGSVSLPRGGFSYPSYGIIDVADNGEVKPQIVGIIGEKRFKVMDI